MQAKKLLVIAAAAAIPFGVAIAGEGSKDKHGGSMAPSFDTLDTNRDGRISQAEAAVDASIVFSTADKDGDGYLSKSEFRMRDKGTSSPTPQSMPQSTDPSGDSTLPETPPASEPQPDTETPRQ